VPVAAGQPEIADLLGDGRRTEVRVSASNRVTDSQRRSNQFRALEQSNLCATTVGFGGSLSLCRERFLRR